MSARMYFVTIHGDTPDDIPAPRRIEEAIADDLNREAEDGRDYNCSIRVSSPEPTPAMVGRLLDALYDRGWSRRGRNVPRAPEEDARAALDAAINPTASRD